MHCGVLILYQIAGAKYGYTILFWVLYIHIVCDLQLGLK